MPAVQMQDMPQGGKELEHYTGAIFQAAGYYVETNVEETEGGDAVLELDIVATDYREGKRQTVLAEAKSGRWGYGDIFKLAGWMEYLDIDRGILFGLIDNLKRNPKTMQDRGGRLSIDVLALDESSDAYEEFNDLDDLRPMGDESAVTAWRWSYWMQEVLLRKLRDRRNSDPSKEGPKRALILQRVLNDELFFEPRIVMRLHNLYDKYKEHPKLTQSVALEAEGHEFDANSEATSQQLQDSLWHGHHNYLQATMFLEHCARISVMKAAVDLSIETDGDLWVNADPPPLDHLLLQMLPKTFRQGMRQLVQQQYFHLYPKFWQSYLWVWGGFHLVDREDDEFEAMSVETGIPADHISDALTSIEVLFPHTKGWFYTQSNTSWKQVKLMPWPFRGLGAVRRLELYDSDDYGDLGYHDYTSYDLVQWHNSMVALLQGTEQVLQ